MKYCKTVEKDPGGQISIGDDTRSLKAPAADSEAFPDR
jgi:hypothetical protein